MKNIIGYILTATLILVLTGSATAQMGSTNYSVTGSVFSSGGEPGQSDNYQINATLGQPTPLMEKYWGVESASYQHYPGFWFASGAYREPTAIQLSSFKAIPKSGQVILEWSTESEIDNAGFNLYRADMEDGEYTKINETIIPAQGSALQGASYEYVDKELKNIKTYYYKLEDIDFNGTSMMHGPVNATPRFIYAIVK